MVLDKLAPVLWTAVALAAVYAVHMVRQWRWMRFDQYADIPQLGKPSFVWGHMKVLNEWTQKGDPRRHLDYILADITKDQNYPPVMMMDIRPLEHPMLVICHADIAEQITKASPRWVSSTPKSPTLRDIHHLTGHASILTDEGAHWKAQRRRLSPGFAPAHLLTLLPVILAKTQRFLAHLDRFAASGETLCLEEYATNLTFDIIGEVTMGRDFRAQVPGRQDELLLCFVGIAQQFRNVAGALRIPGANWRRNRTKDRLAHRIEVLMKDMIRKEHAKVVAGAAAAGAGAGAGAGQGHEDEDQKEEATSGSRSVLALSLQGSDTELSETLLQQTADNLRVFLFAGHDTTSILLQWALYELHRSPRQRAALVAELDALFGPDPDPDAVRARLLLHTNNNNNNNTNTAGGAELLSQMVYTSAVIKETLRLHPPAGSARMSPPGTGFQLTLPGGKQICPDGLVMWINASLIQRDPTVWGETANDFLPERWLGGGSIPAGAWRPFERGPRNCIGQELANIEARVILALVVRKYDFIKTGQGELVLDSGGQPILNEKGYYKTKSDLFNSIQVTAKPVDGTMMKVKLSERMKASKSSCRIS